MGNKTYAKEWLSLAGKNLETAKVLIRENHFSDIIALEVHQTLEKSFKAVYAFYGERIPRTHSLQVLYHFVSNHIDLENISVDDVITISDYYETQRYPGPKYFVPAFDEVQFYSNLVEKIYNQIFVFIENEKL